MAREKNFTYTLTYKDKQRGIVEVNKRVIRAKGYGQSWFSTEQAARKRLENEIKSYKECSFVEEIIGWTLESRDGIIEKEGK